MLESKSTNIRTPTFNENGKVTKQIPVNDNQNYYNSHHILMVELKYRRKDIRLCSFHIFVFLRQKFPIYNFVKMYFCLFSLVF